MIWTQTWSKEEPQVMHIFFNPTHLCFQMGDTKDTPKYKENY